MLCTVAVKQLESVREQFHASTAGLHEGIAAFRPVEGMMTVAQHVAHAAQVIEWLTQGAFNPEGFDLDFEPQIARVMAVTSLEAARGWFEKSITGAILAFQDLEDHELLAAMPEGPVLGGMPRFVVPSVIAEHTSHHRGALTAYARLNGIVPESPYGL